MDIDLGQRETLLKIATPCKATRRTSKDETMPEHSENESQESRLYGAQKIVPSVTEQSRNGEVQVIAQSSGEGRSDGDT